MIKLDYTAMGKQAEVIKNGFRFGFLTVATLVVSVALLAVAHTTGVSAQASQSVANTLKVAPVRSDIIIEPGSSKEVSVTLSNIAKSDISVSASANDFVAGDERGTPALILEEGEYAKSHSLKRFMAPIEDFIIPVGQSKTVKVKITVPSDAKAGGYFGAVRFSPSLASSGGQVNLNASVASLILLTVPGEMEEKLILTDFNIQKNGDTRSMVNNAEDVTTAIRFKNEGNVQLGPFGKISVKKGDTVVYETDFNTSDPRDMVLPDNARRWDVPLKNIDSFGNYTVVATFTYGDKNQTIEATQSFWVIPPFVIAIAGGLLLVIIVLIISLIVFFRRKKQRIPRLGSIK